ncbi:MAG: cytochrome d ubiquinol oxidase subunit II [Alphaproteobacteria bacterium]|nr:cytochrome d ubiquinol oxidase subunit II [Alphaproteobacteria bacterium]
MSESDLPSLAAVAVMLLVGGYVLLDSFALGAGTLCMYRTDRVDRDAILQATAATRYNSEWWLIAAAVVMYFAFPFPFRILAEGLAVPIVVVLVALATRKMAATLRKSADDATERRWSQIFAIAFLVATLAQGLSLGGYLRGFSVAGGELVGGVFSWVSFFSLLVAVALAIGYGMLGAAWLSWKGATRVAERSRTLLRALSIASACAMAAISVATLLLHPIVTARWGVSLDGVDWEYFLPLSPLPAAALVGLLISFLFARKVGSPWPFLGGLAALLAGYAGLAASVWPLVVPYGYSAAQSVGDINDLRVCLLWTAASIPCLIILTAFTFKRWPARSARTMSSAV